MEYTCGMNPTDGKYIFPYFSNTVLKSSEANIYDKVSYMFIKFYQNKYAIFQHYRSSKWSCCENHRQMV